MALTKVTYSMIADGFFSVSDYGAVADNTTNDSAAFQAAIDDAFAAGGGTVVLKPGATYRLVTAPVVKTNVKLDLSEATVNLNFASGSDVFGFDLRDYSAIYNGTINVDEDGPPTGSDKAFHCAVLVGQSGVNLAGYTGWRVSDLVITSNRGGIIGGRGILVQASSNNGIVENIRFPDSADLGSGVQVSWAGPGGNPPATSEHPYNIAVRNIRFGTMTKSGTAFDIAGIDIVGAYNITVDNVQADRWAGDALVQVRVGGFGDTVAPAAIKPLLFKNIIVRNVAAKLCDQHCVIVSGRANDAVGNPVYSVPVVLQNAKAVGPNSSSSYGIRMLHVRNVIVDNCEMEKFQYGCYIEENTRRITIREGRYFNNTFYGVAVVHATTPEDVYVDNVECFLNGSGTATGAGFYVEQCSRVQFNNCISGEDGSDANQIYGFAVASTAAGTKFSGVNRVRSVAAGGTKYYFLAEVVGDRQFGGGSNAALSTSSTEYAPAFGVGLAASNDTVQIRTSVPLILFNFQVLLSAAPGATKTREFQVLDDGTNSTLEVAITGSAVSGIDYGVVEVAAGSTLSIKSLTTNTPAAANASWGFEACVA
jgi:polygalacturonase